MRQHRRATGTSLIELTVGAAVTAIALIGAVAAIASGSSLSVSTTESNASRRVATGVLEEVRATPVDELVETFHGASRSLSEFELGDSSGAADTIVRRADDSTTAWAVYEVTVLVRWATTGVPRSIQFVTYVSDRVRASGLGATQLLQADS